MDPVARPVSYARWMRDGDLQDKMNAQTAKVCRSGMQLPVVVHASLATLHATYF